MDWWELGDSRITLSAASAPPCKIEMFPLLSLCALLAVAGANEDAKRLYDDLLTNYNRYRRPASLPNDTVAVTIKLRLSQIIDVHELHQIMTCSVWLKQSWVDMKLSWQPESYGGVSVLYVPSEMIWLPGGCLI